VLSTSTTLHVLVFGFTALLLFLSSIAFKFIGDGTDSLEVLVKICDLGLAAFVWESRDLVFSFTSLGIITDFLTSILNYYANMQQHFQPIILYQ